MATSLEDLVFTRIAFIEDNPVANRNLPASPYPLLEEGILDARLSSGLYSIEQCADELKGYLRSGNTEEVTATALALCQLGTAGTARLTSLKQFFTGTEHSLRTAISSLIMFTGVNRPNLVRELAELFESNGQSSDVKTNLLGALRFSESEDDLRLRIFRSATNSIDKYRTRIAIQGLGLLGPKADDATDEIIKLGREDASLTYDAVEALIHVGKDSDNASRFLIEMLGKADLQTALRAVQAIKHRGLLLMPELTAAYSDAGDELSKAKILLALSSIERMIIRKQLPGA